MPLLPGLPRYELAALRRYERLLEEACLEEDVPFLPLLSPCWADPHWFAADRRRMGVHLKWSGPSAGS